MNCLRTPRSGRFGGCRSYKCSLGFALFSIVFLLAVAASTSRNASTTPLDAIQRTVCQNEIGSIFSYPSPGETWRDLGAYVGGARSGSFTKMSEDALKIQQGRFQHFQPADEEGYAFFPYSRLKEFERQELAEGRPAFFVTATYQGRKRPVYFAWSLDLRGGDAPHADPRMWMQAVNVSSDRYIDFWVNEYVRKTLWRGRVPLPTWWVGLDNCAFLWTLYGVLDDGGRFVSSVPWDPPFPRNSDEYLASIEQFFHKLKQVAPEIKTMCNIGSLKAPQQFRAIYADVPGVMLENISEFNPKEFMRRDEAEELGWLSWFGTLGRVAVLRAIVPPNDPDKVRTAYAIYLLVKGPNFFIGPEYEQSLSLMPTDGFRAIRAALGEPTGVMRLEPDRIKGSPYNLYSRTYERGIVYVNWTGATSKIKLTAGRAYSDPQGVRLTEVTVPDLTGTYVTIVNNRPAEP